MNLSENQIRSVVEEVVRSISSDASPPAVIPGGFSRDSGGENGVFEELEGAVQAAATAQRDLESLSLETRRAIIDALRQASLDHAKGLAQMTMEETGMGRIAHKIKKFENFGREKNVFGIFSPVLEVLDIFGCQKQLPRAILLWIHLL